MYIKKLTSLILTLTLGSSLIVVPSHIVNAKVQLSKETTIKVKNEIPSSSKITEAQKKLLDSFSLTDTSTLETTYAKSFSEFFKTTENIIETAKKHGINYWMSNSYSSSYVGTSCSSSNVNLYSDFTREEHSVNGVFNLTDSKKNIFKQSMKDLFKVTMGLSDSQIKELNDTLKDAINIYNNTTYGTLDPIYFVRNYCFDGKIIKFYVYEGPCVDPNLIYYNYQYDKSTNIESYSIAKDVIPVNKTIYNHYIDSIEEANKAQLNFTKNLPKEFKLDKSLPSKEYSRIESYNWGEFSKSASKTIIDSKTKQPIAKLMILSHIKPIVERNDLEIGAIDYGICYIPLKKGRSIKSKELQYIIDIAVTLEPRLNKNTLKSLWYNSYYGTPLSAGYEIFASTIPTKFGDSYKLIISKRCSELRKR